MTDDRRLLLGEISGVHGIRGWVKLVSHTEPRDNIFSYRPWILTHRGEEWRVEKARGQAHGKGLIAHWPALQDRSQAESLIGACIWLDRANLPEPGPQEYYWTDLEGLAVIGLDGFDFGRVSHLFETGSNDVLVVSGERQRAIPFLIGTVVRRVDLDAGRIEVDWDPEF